MPGIRQDLWRILVPTVLLALSGCGDLVSTMRYSFGYTGQIIVGFLGYAGGAGPIHVRLLNNPFGDPGIAGMVAAESDAAVPIRVKFTADAAAAGRPDWRLVVMFNPPAGANVRDACESPDAIVAVAPGSGTELMASFCNDRKLIAGVRAVTGTIANAADPRLKRLVRGAIGDLFSPSNFDNNSDNEIFTGQLRGPKVLSRQPGSG
ncbi:MAG: hypothetical protein EXQ92_01835 [Alphaproteobacteria bacterium]|nr:hypothetical protein [Alphaproteobacteria bacterium]